MRDGRYLLAQHNSRRPDRIGKWGLPGGRLKKPEEPKAALRRELVEELRLEVPYLVELGDWLFREQTHRVFGCEIDDPVGWFDTDEILGIAWFSYDEVAALEEADQLHKGFEFGAIRAFRARIELGDSPGFSDAPRRLGYSPRRATPERAAARRRSTSAT
jgi:8-oxo-dGTP pyrophosphatase MutT (NUDIX family)